MTGDARTLERVAGGDPSAFEPFVRRHEAAVLRYLRTRTSDPDVVEDALQETFIAAWRAAGTFRGDASARAWLLTIARNAVRRQFRRAAGQPERHDPLEAVGLSEVAVGAGWGRGPEDQWTDRIAAGEMVSRGFEQLSGDDREILLLRDLEGFGNEEVAEMLELSVAAVKSRVHRARLRFMESVRGMHESA